MKQRHFHIVPLVVSLDGSAIHNTRVDAIFTTRKAVQNVQPTWASESYARNVKVATCWKRHKYMPVRGESAS